MVLAIDFTCPKGHSFTANAKLRARCPSCGAMARRSFSEKVHADPPKEEPPTENPEEKPPVEPAKPETKVGPIVIRSGRPRAAAKKPAPKPVVEKKSIVLHKRVPKAVVPRVKGLPRGNKEHKVSKLMGEDKPYWMKVKDKYFKS